MKSFCFFRERYAFLTLFIFVFPLTYASGEEPVLDTRSISLGSIHALSRELANPAFLSFHSSMKLEATVYNRFEMKELNTLSISAIAPNRYLDAGFKLSTFGYSDYRLLIGQAGFSKKVNNQLSLGVNLHCVYESTTLAEDSKMLLNADIGTCFVLNETISLAVLARNSATNSFSIHTGINYQVFKSCDVLLELGSDCKNQFNLMTGIEYELMNKFYVRSGIQTSSKSPAFGFAYSFDALSVDVGFVLHQVLGKSSSIGVSYQF